MKNKTKSVSRTLIIGIFFCAQLVSPAFSSTHDDINLTTLVGWSSDGKLIAFDKTVGFWDMENPGKNWQIEYVSVRSLSTMKTIETYQIKKSSVPIVINENSERTKPWLHENRASLKAYERARSYQDWVDFENKMAFKRLGVTSINSPSEKWTIGMEVENGRYALKTTTGTAKLEGESEDFSCGRVIDEVVLKYNAFPTELKSNGKWMLTINALSVDKKIPIASSVLEYNHDLPRGRFRGCINAYWGPDENSVAIEWTWRPIVDGMSSIDVAAVALPD